MGNRSSSATCRESVRNRHKVLMAALQNPSETASKIFEACTSQASLAAFSMPEKGITALSRNSLYKFANLELTEEQIPSGHVNEGAVGYPCLDWLRKQVKHRGKEKSHDRSRSAQANRFQHRIKELTHQADELMKYSLALSKAYFNLFKSLKGLHADESVSAITRQRIANLMNDHDRLYSELLVESGTLRPGNLESIQN